MTDTSRPTHLTPDNAAAFQLAGVVDAYHLRTPYPIELGPFLRSLMSPTVGAIVELGCGTGEIARMLAPHVDRVDAIDVSLPMLERARTMPDGSHTSIRWIYGSAEDAALDGPYALAVAGDALHWMNWGAVLARIQTVLAPGAYLAIVHAMAETPPWSTQLRELIGRYSVMQDFEPFDLVEELTAQRLFVTVGERTIGGTPFSRSINDYVEGLHATAWLPRERMRLERARAFDGAVSGLVAPHAVDGTLSFAVSAHVVWGKPGSGVS